ncbi:unknown [Singapore grouper iridovirus]|uniref:Uncharacterized protein n=2 Tax=Singapore grouper iridovirus TaxID=262968 RepID=Q5GAF6_9VIRU|nr:hypothetical protein ORF105R [Singapore grouper iridovirus]AAS18120.1 unknown [Singapore grouper iridovirus]AAV91087.1 unknown protein [Grouper iridovirus]WAU86814.1 hypothetical protein ORF105R [Singapore grouper iridovirus]
MYPVPIFTGSPATTLAPAPLHNSVSALLPAPVKMSKDSSKAALLRGPTSHVRMVYLSIGVGLPLRIILSTKSFMCAE